MRRPVVGYGASVDDNPRAPARIASFATALGVFGATATGVLVAGRREGRLPDRYASLDLALGALATQKFTRLLAKDSVTTPLRAPFTRFAGEGAPAEVNERPKKHNPAQHTLGELLVCPFCLAPWVAGAYVTGLAFAPRVARAWAAVFSMVSVSDDLQYVYARLQDE
jgi:hypothetical protein